MNASKKLCMMITEAIADERKAPADYDRIIISLRNEGLITNKDYSELINIVAQEIDHEKIFTRISKDCGCEATRKRRQLFSDLPLSERLSMAREALSRMESVHKR